MVYKFTVYGTLPGINQFIAAQNRNRHAGNEMKQASQELVSLYIRRYLKVRNIKKPVQINYTFIEPNKKRDKDNIAGFAHKVIQDALVACHVLQNDGWANIAGFSDSFSVDKNKPRIEVELVEV